MKLEGQVGPTTGRSGRHPCLQFGLQSNGSGKASCFQLMGGGGCGRGWETNTGEKETSPGTLFNNPSQRQRWRELFSDLPDHVGTELRTLDYRMWEPRKKRASQGCPYFPACIMAWRELQTNK